MKLPKPIQRGSSWRITVTFQKKRYSVTRDSAKECEIWAMDKLSELRSGKKAIEQGEKPKYLFRDLCAKYYQEHGRHMRSARTINFKIKNLDRIALPKDKKLAQDLSKAVAAALGSRLRGNEGWIDQSQSARGKLGFISNGGLIVELGFISNEDEISRFNARYWLAAKAVADVLIDYEKRN